MSATFRLLPLMLVMAGCAAHDPAPIPQPPAPAPAAPELPTGTPASGPDTLGWVPDALQPTGSQVQDLSRPWGDLDHPVVVIQDNRYHPYYIHVRLGGSVTWINRDPKTQSVTSPIPGGATQEGYWEGVMAPGESYTKTFSRFTGTFTYHSTYTTDLRGNVIVVGSGR